MPNYDAVINITNSFNAATKLRNMNIGDMRSGQGFKNLYQSPELLGKALKTIAQHSPGDYRDNNLIYERIDRGTMLLNTYYELNNKINNAKANGYKSRDIMEMASLVKPILPDKHKITIEKMIKIIDILNT